MWKSAINANYDPRIELTRISHSDNPLDNKLAFAAATAYGIHAIKYDDIIKNPHTFNQMVSEVKSIRKVSHTQLLRKLRSEVSQDYKQSRNKSDKEVANHYRYNDKENYYQLRHNKQTFFEQDD